MPQRSRSLEHCIVISYFALLVGLCTFPLITDLAALSPPHHDPRLFGWVMVSNTHRAIEAPEALFDGNALYPYGNTIAFSEPLLVPTLTFAPVYAITGNPVLAYNVTLLFFWALSGWTFYYAARELVRSRIAALVGATAFVVCQYRIVYYLEFQMELVAGMPLALLFWYRAITQPGWRDAILSMIFLWLTMVSSIYYGIILGCALCLFAGFHYLLRPRAWSPSLVGKLAAAIGTTAAATLPVLLPYAQTRSELGLERSLRDAVRHSADLLTYVTARSTRIYQFDLDPRAETVMFMGFAVLGLAGLALLRSRRSGEWRALPIWPRRALAASAGLVVGETVLRGSDWLNSGYSLIPWLLPATLALALWCMFLGGRTAGAEGELRYSELSAALTLLAFAFLLLSLGPWVRVGGDVVGPGLHAYLYSWVPLFRAVRVMTRFGVIFVLSVSLLATLGMAGLLRGLQPSRRAAIGIGVLLLVIVESWSAPLAYERSPWPPHDSPYGSLDSEVPAALLEIPFYADKRDCWYMFNSALHWKYVVNGFSGFVPPITRAIEERAGRYGENLRDESVRRWLRQIYPLNTVVLHLHSMPEPWRQYWLGTALPEGLALQRQSEEHIIVSLLPAVDTAPVITRTISPEYGRLHPNLKIRARLHGSRAATSQQVIRVLVNGTEIAAQKAAARVVEFDLALPDSLPTAAPTAIEIAPGYSLRRQARARQRYVIGATASRSPVDVEVVAVAPLRGLSRILINGTPWTATERHRDILVAIEPESGAILRTAALGGGQAVVLRQLLDALPDGTIVAVALASAPQRRELAESLAALGAASALDPDHPYALIGVKGAPEATALEGQRPNTVRRAVGPRRLQVEILDFELR